jgi:hypothetical protein
MYHVLALPLLILVPCGDVLVTPATGQQPPSAEVAPTTAPTQTLTPAPDSIWDRLKLYADGRIRAEGTFDQLNGEDRHRGRFRFRVGGDYTISEDFKAGARLTTLSDGRDANNPHWDFGDGDGFSAAEVGLDRLFIEWSAADSVKLIGGKFAHTFTRPPVTGEFAWDDDVQPAGAALNWSPSEKTDTVKYDLRLITVVATEINASDDSGNDPAEHALQGNLSFQTGETTNLNFGTSYSKWTNLSRFPETSTAGNTADAEGFGIWDTFVAVNWTPEDTLPLTVYGQFLQNLEDESGEDVGLVAGAQLGHKSGKGRWNVFASAYSLDANSVFAPVAQDDTPVAGTGTGSGMDGFILGGQYFITDNFTLRIWALTSDVDGEEDPYRIRFDLDFRVR